MRFRPEQHLRRPGEIRAVRERGRRLECRAFTLWWKRRDPVSAPVSVTEAASLPAVGAPVVTAAPAPAGARVCVIASTAAVGAAHRRNRAKRRLREVFRHQQAAVPADCDLLLIARAAVTGWPMADLEKKFAEACRQIPAAPQSAASAPSEPRSAPAPASPPRSSLPSPAPHAETPAPDRAPSS